MSLTPSGPGPFASRRWGIRFVFVAVLLAIALRTLVFRTLEGWSILDSLYVTVQTVTTVGYGDLTPKTTAGRAFATGFMLCPLRLVSVPPAAPRASVVQ